MCKQCTAVSYGVTNSPEEAPIVKALNYQNDELNACELELESLENRLEPVLDSVLRDDNKENAGATPVSEKVLPRVDDVARRIAGVTARIRDLQSRLQI